MILTISKVEQGFTKNGDEFKKVTGVVSDGSGTRETTKSVFNNLQEKWPLLVVGKTLDFKMEKKGQFWNTVDINPIEAPPPQPATTAPIPQEHQPQPAYQDKRSQEIEINMWWKLLGEAIFTKDLDTTKPAGKTMRTAFYAKMLSVLDIKIENKSQTKATAIELDPENMPN